MKTPARTPVPEPHPTAVWLRPFMQLPRLIRFADLRLGTDKRRIVIGKSRNCDIWIEGDDLVSGEHCALEALGDGYWIEDLESTNGTIHNHVSLHDRAPLRVEHTIQFGQSSAVLVDDSKPLPIVASTHSSFLARAHEMYGSSRAAGEAINRSHASIQRATRKRKPG